MKVNREALLKSLESVLPGLARREIIEQSDCFIFRGGKVATFDDEVACVADSPLDLEVAVKADPLVKLLRKLKEPEIDVEHEKGMLQIKGKGKRAGISVEKEITLPVEAVDAPEKWRKLPEGFLKAVSLVSSCASSDESRFVLTCIHIHPDWVEATDDYQICRHPLATRFDGDILVRAASLRHVVSMRPKRFGQTENWCHFDNGSGMTLSCRRYIDKYPDLGQFLDVKGSKIELPKGLAEAIDKAKIFSAEDVGGDQVTVEIRPDKLVIKGRGPSGWYAEQKKIEYHGKPTTFSTSPGLLLEIARKTNTCLLSDGCLKVEGDGFTYITCVAKPSEEE